MKSLEILLVSVVLALGESSCSSSGKQADVIGSPGSVARFSMQASVGNVVADAHFYENNAEVFDTDLIDDYGVLPVKLLICLRGSGQAAEKAFVPTFDELDAMLYLPDGTPLHSIRIIPEDDDKRKQVVENSLDASAGLIQTRDKANTGFVFFKLPADAEYSADNHTITLARAVVARPLDVTQSLCSFNVRKDDDLVRMFVGLQLAPRTR